MVLEGRLGLETARIPHVDRHGLLWLARGNLWVKAGTLRFRAARSASLDAGDYAVPYQTVSVILLGPGTTVSHDALRICARHGTGIIAVGDDGVRAYTFPPLGPDQSAVARNQALLWADEQKRRHTARRLYGWRMGEIFPDRNLNVLRGMEGVRMKALYRTLAAQYGIRWRGRRYRRDAPDWADAPNQAINHAATAVEAAAMIAVASVGALPQLGFIHEHPGVSFVLDVADLYRGEVTLPVAFSSVREHESDPRTKLERVVRLNAGREFRRRKLIPHMIDRSRSCSMAMCVIVTRDVPMRFRGFLASCMLEIAPGVYTQPGHVQRRARARVEGPARLVVALLPRLRGDDLGPTPAPTSASRWSRWGRRRRRSSNTTASISSEATTRRTPPRSRPTPRFAARVEEAPDRVRR